MTPVPERLAAVLADRYRIDRELGQGGMATVFLAHDVKHDRKVALKVLKPELAAVLGAERFVAEIKTTAALQHPHILPLFDSGNADSFLYYVMPFIQGETLRDKLNRETQLGVEESIRIATDVADALQYAHDQGVIHRDIKPENILLANGRPMVADFGIALAVSAAAGGRMTETGLSLGTPHYMSPEQATADKDLTRRSDLYSLATVLYEMLTGSPPHTGSSAQQIIMKIVVEPAAPVTQVRRTVPPNVAAALAKALEKLPADRFESAQAFAAALADPGFVNRAGTTAFAAATGTPRRWNRLTVAMTAVAAVLTIALTTSIWPRGGGPPSPANPVIRFTLVDDPALVVETGSTRPFAVSPDGRTIVFRAGTDSTPPQLWVRTLDDPHPRRLLDTEDGMNPAISPDGQWVAFLVRNRHLRKAPLAGGAVVDVVTIDGISAALHWGSADQILLETISPEDGIHRVRANGGKPERVVPLDTAGGEISQRRPMLLPGEDVIAYGSTTRGRDQTELVLYRPSDRRRVQLGLSGIGPLGMIDDRLVYAGAQGELLAVRLDIAAMKAVGTPVTLTPRAVAGWVGSAVGLSAAGTLVHLPADGGGAAGRLELVDTNGVARTLPGSFPVHGTPRFSPDGRRLVVALGTGGVQGRRRGITFADLWLVDVATGEPTRLTSGNFAGAASFSSDGRRVLFSADVSGKPGVWSVPVDGSAPPSPLVDVGDVPRNTAMAPDGKSVIAVLTRGGAAASAMVRHWLDGSRRVDTLLSMAANGLRASDPRISPDGRWVAFTERSDGDVWVRSLHGPGLLQVSLRQTDGNPTVWGPDSRRIYFATVEGLHVIELQTSPSLTVTRRRLLGRFAFATDYDLSPDGRTFAVVLPIKATSPALVTVNWADEARRAWTAEPAR